MKKIMIMILISLAGITNLNIISVNAQESDTNLQQYILILDDINDTYNSNLSIHDREGFIKSSIAHDYNNDYNISLVLI